jgi:uncharacterized protein (DUF4415 family)
MRDRDGWLIDPKTGALIGPDPEIERELTDAELKRAKPRGGRPRLPAGQHRRQLTLRLSPDTIAALRALGPGWNAFAEEAVLKALKRRSSTAR